MNFYRDAIPQLNGIPVLFLPLPIMMGFLADLLNGFSLSDIPLLILQIASAALMSYLASLLLLRQNVEKNIRLPLLISIVTAFLAAISKQSIPLSILGAGSLIILFILAREKTENQLHLLSILLSIAAGLGMGSGFVAITWLVFILFIVPALFLKR